MIANSDDLAAILEGNEETAQLLTTISKLLRG
jgi:hypothetical protein